ncbi:MAG: indole-3-glycerol phosphate synthase TrpC [Candidatus Omnitrophica bacterium]|nr:indole-3-glycerol phosphate synthase TrpC [Candidatus Omnitrophota bacterium]
MILDEILDSKRAEVKAAKRERPLEDLAHRLRGHLAERSFCKALEASPKPPALIAELKRQSPSRGMLRERFDPVSLAQQMQDAGAAALSVLTDEPFFGGKLEFLRDVRQFTDLPLLRKDFIVDPYQVYEAAAHGADAVLLIARILSADELRDCLQAAETLGLDALVEVHGDAELDTALRVGSRLIGINHRDLDTFTMHPDTTARLLPKIPKGKVVVAESGIASRDDVRRLKDLGVHAVLIGEALMTAPDVSEKIRELFTDIW